LNSFDGPVQYLERISRDKSLSAATVSTIVDKLLERGILIEVSTAPSSGGRPPVLLSVDPKAGFVVESTSGDGVTTVICDLAARLWLLRNFTSPCGRFGGCHSRHRDRGATSNSNREVAAAKVLASASDFRASSTRIEARATFLTCSNGQMSNSPNRFVAIWHAGVG